MLRRYQEEALHALEASQRRRRLLNMACGTGKTVVAAAFIRSRIARGVAFLVPTRALARDVTGRLQDDLRGLNDLVEADRFHINAPNESSCHVTKAQTG